MSKGERIILKDDKGKQYEVIRVLDLDTKKTIDDLSALVIKKDKIIEDMAEHLTTSVHSKEWVIKYFEVRCK